MPKPKKKQPSKNPIQEVLEKARVLDRYRQAQIENQRQSITRLLERFDDGKAAGTSHAVYTEEMGILHGAYADANAEAGELRDALTALVSAIDAITPRLTQVDWGTLADALAQARALTAAESSQEASAG